MTIGKRLREFRHYKEATQADFSKSVGVSQPALAAYEKDEREPPFSVAVILCRDHNANPEWLLYGVGPMVRGREQELIRQALRVTKERLPAIIPNATFEQEADFTALIYQYLVENATISPPMADAIFRVGAVNE